MRPTTADLEAARMAAILSSDATISAFYSFIIAQRKTKRVNTKRTKRTRCVACAKNQATFGQMLTHNKLNLHFCSTCYDLWMQQLPWKDRWDWKERAFQG